MAKGKYEYWLTNEGLILLEGWARDGLTDEQIAHNMGITSKTLYEWKNKYGDICESMLICGTILLLAIIGQIGKK